MKKLFGLVTVSALAAPLLAFAQAARSTAGTINLSKVQELYLSVIHVINYILVPILMAVAFLMFLWGVYKYYILNGDSDTERKKGHTYVLWGVIGFVVILSVWGLVNIVGSTLGLQFGGRAPETPKI